MLPETVSFSSKGSKGTALAFAVSMPAIKLPPDRPFAQMCELTRVSCIANVRWGVEAPTMFDLSGEKTENVAHGARDR